MLLLEVGMIGVFVALDLFLFYVFFELSLIPMALLIGIWGSANRVYAAIKFFLYTLAGSLLMLVGIVATYQAYFEETGVRTLNVLQLATGNYGSTVPVVGLRRLLPGLRDQGADVAVPHLVAGRPRRGADGRVGACWPACC